MAGAHALPLPTGDSGGLTLASNELTRVTDRVRQTHISQVGGNAPYISESWQGAAAQSRTAEADRLRHRISFAASRLPVIASALMTYREVLDTTTANVGVWQRRWDEAEEAYRAQLRRLNNAPWPDEDRQVIANGYADERDITHRRLREQHTVAMSDLRDAGRAAAATIRGQCDLVVPPARAGDRLEIGAYILRDLPLSGGEAMSEYADALAPQLVELIGSELATDDPAVLAEIVENYQRYASDPYFAHAVMDRLGADGLMSAFQDLLVSNGVNRGDDELVTQQRAVQDLLGTLLVAASGEARGDITGDSYNHHVITQWREDVWYDALRQTGRTAYAVSDPLRLGTVDGTVPGYWVQGLLLAAADQSGLVPGRPFMEEVGTDMVEWDRERGEEDKRGWGIVPPMYQPSLSDDGSPLAQYSTDPIYALLHAASQDEQATYGLLLSSTTEDGPQTVVEYLLRERGGTMSGAGPFADHGQLLAETVAAHGVDRSDEESTALAAHYLNAYIETVDSGQFTNGQRLDSDTLTGSRSATADLVIAHLEDLIRASGRSDGGSELYDADGEDAWEIYFHDNTKFANFFGFLGTDRPEEIAYASMDDRGDVTVVGDPTDPPALQRIVNAAVAHNAASLNAAYAAGPAGDPTVVARDAAGFLIYATESAGQEQLAAAEAEDAYRAYLARLAQAGVGMVPVEAVPVVGAPLSVAYDLTAEAVLGHVISTDHATQQAGLQGEVRDNLRILLEQQGRMAIIQAGAWEEGKDPVTWAANNYLTEEQDFIRDGEVIPFEELFDGSDENAHRRSAFLNKFLVRQDGGAGVAGDMRETVGVAVLDALDRAGIQYDGDD